VIKVNLKEAEGDLEHLVDEAAGGGRRAARR
jgi:hypothetical protein